MRVKNKLEPRASLAEHVLCQEVVRSLQSHQIPSFQIPLCIQDLSKLGFRASLSSPRSCGSRAAAALCFQLQEAVCNDWSWHLH